MWSLENSTDESTGKAEIETQKHREQMYGPRRKKEDGEELED